MQNLKEGEIKVETVLSQAYQITIPSVVRKALGLQPGDQISVKVEKGQAVLRREESREEKIRRLFADLEMMKKEREKRMTLKEKKFAEMAAGWTINQYHEYYDSLPEAKARLKEKYGV